MPISKYIDAQLLAQRKIAEENDAKRRADQLGLPYLDLVSTKVPTEIDAMKLVPEEDAKKALLAPLQLIGKKLVIAVFNPAAPTAKQILDSLAQNYEVHAVVASRAGLAHAWSYYQYVQTEAKDIAGKVEIDETNLQGITASIKSLDDVRAAIQNFKSPYVSQMLEIILGGALALKASDIHLEPKEDTGLLRLRVDGMLHPAYESFSKTTYHSIITRIKLLSNVKLNLTDRPQDGRFTIGLKDRDIEIRASLIPSEYGETAVLRLLDPLSLKVKLEELGWRSDDLEIVRKEIEKPNGLILNTGPTGSGKTTTLYAFLKHVVTPEIKVITVEDPIEYHLDGVSQTQVDPEAGYTFASGLRSILRQDPDVILVGEIRDAETAEIAMNAALTGHMVFSTLHTNDAVGAIPRLIDLGAKPQVIGPAVSLIIAQRLVRVLCPHCKEKMEVSAVAKKKIEEFLSSLPKRVNSDGYKTITMAKPKGCEKCGGLGYRGRTSIFELFEVTENIEQAIYQNPNEIELKVLAKKQGMTTMQEDGVLKILQGITSKEEVERATGPIEWLVLS
ncbi:MAG: GspE/PulE family protein [Candidatus Jorgensenbacteria bacterium]|nr:GspE/PulE family protein [Candidatus Jorgensenbacteria bacterium]